MVIKKKSVVEGEKATCGEGWGGLFPALVGLQLYLLQFLVGPALVPLCQVSPAQEPVCLCHLGTEIAKHCHFGLQGLSQDGGSSL